MRFVDWGVVVMGLVIGASIAFASKRWGKRLVSE